MSEHIGTFIQGSSIISHPISYTVDGEEVDLSEWELSYNLFNDATKNLIFSDVITDRHLNINGAKTEDLKGNFIIQIVFKNGTFVDKNTLLIVTITGV